ncbi:MAG: helix-turn-helix transcriptional regulator [Acholeplasmataceae bacterium]|jgi:transcriptional regulator with XRE-family HTH domain|nr:helix-turn-helix transcriptional regulator [Acholeplasmataceae bacterium]
MIDLRSVGRKIQSLRVEHKLTQDELAEKLFVTRQALSKWENGQSAPTIDNILLLSRLFNVTFEEILCLNEKTEFDKKDLFKNHDRYLIINKIISGELVVKLEDVFYQFSPLERMTLLKKVKDGTLKTDITELSSKLTTSELKFLLGG